MNLGHPPVRRWSRWRRRGARTVVAVLVALVLSSALPLAALATTHTPPWADAISSHYGGTNGLNTTGSGANMKSRTIQMGYSGFNDIGVAAASTIGNGYAPDDAVWAIFGHAAPGYISTYYNSAYTYLNATSAVGSCSYPNACLTQLGTNAHRVKLAMFVGCQTGLSASGVNLLTTARVTNGMDSALGFNQLIYWPQADLWTDQFFWYAYAGPYSVSDSAWYAEAVVVSHYGSAYGFDSVVTQNGTIKIYPVGYGS